MTLMRLRPVPILVEAEDRVARRAFDDLGFSDRDALGVFRSVKKNRRFFVEHAHLRAATESPLFEDDAALFFDFGRIERDAVGPVAEHADRFVEELGFVRRDLQRVNGFVEVRVRVQIRAERDAAFFEHVDDRLLRKSLRAVERHVLDEVREPALIVVFEHRARVHREPHLRAMLRFLVRENVIGEPARERALRDARVERKRLIVGRSDRRRDGPNRFRRRDVLRGRTARSEKERERSKDDGEEAHGRAA